MCFSLYHVPAISLKSPQKGSPQKVSSPLFSSYSQITRGTTSLHSHSHHCKNITWKNQYFLDISGNVKVLEIFPFSFSFSFGPNFESNFINVDVSGDIQSQPSPECPVLRQPPPSQHNQIFHFSYDNFIFPAKINCLCMCLYLVGYNVNICVCVYIKCISNAHDFMVFFCMIL